MFCWVFYWVIWDRFFSGSDVLLDVCWVFYYGDWIKYPIPPWYYQMPVWCFIGYSVRFIQYYQIVYWIFYEIYPIILDGLLDILWDRNVSLLNIIRLGFIQQNIPQTSHRNKFYPANYPWSVSFRPITQKIADY